MKKSIKLAVFAIITAIVLLAFYACSSPSGGGSETGGDTSKQEDYTTYTAYDEDGNAFILVVTENDTYVLSIVNENGANQGSSTGTVIGSNSTSFTLKSKGGVTFVVTININVIVSIGSPIPLDNGEAYAWVPGKCLAPF